MYTYLVTYWIKVPIATPPNAMYLPRDMRLERSRSIESEDDPLAALKEAILKHEGAVNLTADRVFLNNLIFLRSRP